MLERLDAFIKFKYNEEGWFWITDIWSKFNLGESEKDWEEADRLFKKFKENQQQIAIDSADNTKNPFLDAFENKDMTTSYEKLNKKLVHLCKYIWSWMCQIKNLCQ